MENDAAGAFHLGPLHAVMVWRECGWPRQWIGSCSCGRGIRCNSKADAWGFFDREGCALGGTVDPQ